MKINKLLNMLVLLPIVSLTACEGTNGYRLYERQELVTLNDYYGMRTLGTGYSAESFTTVEVTPDESYRIVSNVKALVVLVDFTDALASSMPKGEEGTINDLDKLVFGQPEDTQWHSLASYYKASSFGQCNITGLTIDKPYHTGMSVTQFGSYNGATKSNGTPATMQLVRDIQSWLKKPVDQGGYGWDASEMKKYDGNRDGYVDSLIMIYTCDPHVRIGGKEVNDELYWAYCHSVSTRKGNIDEPVCYRYFWASYQTFFENGYWDESGYHNWTAEQKADGTAKLDAHTLIHEFGHVLSLPDYYNGNYGSSSMDAYDPLMSLDMMAWNIGDHNSFSKALYGWVSPYVVSGPSKITIRSTTDTGDFILVPVKGKFKGTLLSQYIIVEFLTPTGVANFDSLHQYANSYPQWFTQPGVRVCLVDARPGMFDNRTGNFINYTASVIMGDNYYVTFAHDNNNIERGAYPNCKIIEMIPNNETNDNENTVRYMNQRAKDENLFHQGDILGRRGGAFPKGIMCHGQGENMTGSEWLTRLGFSLKVEKITADSCTISFARA